MEWPTFRQNLSSPMAENMTIDAFLSMLLAQDWDYMSNAAIERLIRSASSGIRPIPNRLTTLSQEALTEIRWKGWHPLSLSNRQRIFLSKDHRPQAKASLHPPLVMKVVKKYQDVLCQ